MNYGSQSQGVKHLLYKYNKKKYKITNITLKRVREYLKKLMSNINILFTKAN